MTTTENPLAETLRTGDLAFIDSFAGLVPCKILEIEKYIGKGLTASTRIKVRVTAERGAYKRGELLTYEEPYNIVARRAVYTRDHQYRIRGLMYTYEPTKEPADV